MFYLPRRQAEQLARYGKRYPHKMRSLNSHFSDHFNEHRKEKILDCFLMSSSPAERSRKRQVTQADVARLAGVSRSIISYVINNGPRSVSPETRDRVLDAIQTLDYRPNKHAQMLMQEKWDSVAADQLGVIISSVNMFKRPYYGEILAGIHEEAHRRNHHIRFIRLFEALRNPALLNQIVHKQEVSGLVFLALDQVLQGEPDTQLFRQIVERIDRTVCLEWHHEGLPSVNFDRHRAALEATNHLLRLGHRSLAYIGPKDQRIQGFRTALAEAELVPSLIAEANDAHSGFEQTTALFDPPPGVTAMVAGSDEVAFGVLKSFRQRGVKVPEDVALVSIDNIDLSEFAAPGLTTVSVPKRELGQQAVKMLVEPAAASPVLVTLPTRLVIRESCGSRGMHLTRV